ncbi:hypothetical protein STSP2_00762 [Anaerohalosphaera lusitana]|uniref:Uncharacterized protein n=1 Tax=Anaerohalosphaera lusitana TaxID=1936003 RepID=A0A1U9NIQ8_9BACT|nr:hypothetical protein [Anaerohalosphaera lusitana]AQT67614.1 hypothetical protein STSP2_00762 [Anaerohalosphaera lusitana]
MRLFCTLLISLPIIAICGCGPQAQTAEGDDELLIVEFDPDRPVSYRMVSERVVDVNLGQKTGGGSQTATEKLELIMSYKPQGEINPYGLTTIEATCRSASVQRKTLSGRTENTDAVTFLQGKTFTFKVGPTGKIEDYTDLERVVKELGAKAFAGSADQGNIKNADMISDFVTLQWYLWDSVGKLASANPPVEVGREWQTTQLIPFASPIRGIRRTTYELTDIKTTDEGKKAVFAMSFEPTTGKLENIPVPYDRQYRMRGLFGFLRNYELKSLEGSGKQVFNIDRGVVESETQNYTVKLSASFMLPLQDTEPALTVDQNISIDLIEQPEL